MNAFPQVTLNIVENTVVVLNSSYFQLVIFELTFSECQISFVGGEEKC